MINYMSIRQKKFFVEVTITSEQKEFLNKLAEEKSILFGERVSVTKIIRALLNREMDEYKLRKGICDEEI